MAYVLTSGQVSFIKSSGDPVSMARFLLYVALNPLTSEQDSKRIAALDISSVLRVAYTAGQNQEELGSSFLPSSSPLRGKGLEGHLTSLPWRWDHAELL